GGRTTQAEDVGAGAGSQQRRPARREDPLTGGPGGPARVSTRYIPRTVECPVRLPLLITAVALCTACQPMSTAEYDSNAIARASAEAHEAIDAINVRYQRFVAENMPDSVAALFAEDGVMMSPNAPAVT